MPTEARISPVKEKLLFGALVIWSLLMLLPIARNGKGCSFIAYCLLLVAVAVYGVCRTSWSARFVAALFAFFLVTFALPVDVVIGEGETFGFVWSEETPSDSVYAHRNRILGVKPRWVLQVVIP
jgi:hypothetical protein